MPRDKWKLTQAVPGAPEVEQWGDLLEFLADEPDSGVVRVEPGVYLCGDQEGAQRLLAQHQAFKARMAAKSDPGD